MKIFFLTISLLFFQESFSQSDSTLHTLKVRLIKAQPNPPGCGVVAWALTQKFEIIESDFLLMKPGYSILLNQPCPDFFGADYFRRNRTYIVKVAKDSGDPFSYTVINNYEKEKLPLFWIREIQLIIN